MDAKVLSGTVGGTAITMIVNLNYGELANTAAVAFVGATVSFLVSYVWKSLFKKMKIK